MNDDEEFVFAGMSGSRRLQPREFIESLKEVDAILRVSSSSGNHSLPPLHPTNVNQLATISVLQAPAGSVCLATSPRNEDGKGVRRVPKL